MSIRHAKGPSEGVVVERLRTEATNWVNAVALQSGRIGRRHRKPNLNQAEVQALEVDLHFFLVSLVRLRRCIERTAQRVPALEPPLRDRLRVFDKDVPSLLRLRNALVSTLTSTTSTRAATTPVSRRQTQTWFLGTTEGGGPIWHPRVRGQLLGRSERVALVAEIDRPMDHCLMCNPTGELPAKQRGNVTPRYGRPASADRQA
jgi:hypothetical protein